MSDIGRLSVHLDSGHLPPLITPNRTEASRKNPIPREAHRYALPPVFPQIASRASRDLNSAAHLMRVTLSIKPTLSEVGLYLRHLSVKQSSPLYFLTLPNQNSQ